MSGALDLILGFLIWRLWPVSGLWAVGILVGMNLLSTGMALVALAMTWNRTVHAVKNEIEVAKAKTRRKVCGIGSLICWIHCFGGDHFMTNESHQQDLPRHFN